MHMQHVSEQLGKGGFSQRKTRMLFPAGALDAGQEIQQLSVKILGRLLALLTTFVYRFSNQK